jgi:hypothetical protein
MTTQAEALEQCFISPNVADSNFEPANVVDVLRFIADNIGSLADAAEANLILNGPFDEDVKQRVIKRVSKAELDRGPV